jgi:microcystin-dependent protein
MATITGMTAQRMQEIEGASIVDGEIVGGDLILTKYDGSQINAGPVTGPAGPQGPIGLSAIPGEVKLWPSDALPDFATYGRYVWCDGAVYNIIDHPIAAANISALWKTMYGVYPDPGAGMFRVPDLRGLVPAGLDAMPGGVRANRLTRSVAIQLAKITGEEQHSMQVAEMPSHAHTVNSHSHGGRTLGADRSLAHVHNTTVKYNLVSDNTHTGAGNYVSGIPGTGGSASSNPIASDSQATPDHLHTINAEAPGTDARGSGTAHENVQPTVMVPYIVCLDE